MSSVGKERKLSPCRPVPTEHFTGSVLWPLPCPLFTEGPPLKLGEVGKKQETHVTCDGGTLAGYWPDANISQDK